MMCMDVVVGVYLQLILRSSIGGGGGWINSRQIWYWCVVCRQNASRTLSLPLIRPLRRPRSLLTISSIYLLHSHPQRLDFSKVPLRKHTSQQHLSILLQWGKTTNMYNERKAQQDNFLISFVCVYTSLHSVSFRISSSYCSTKALSVVLSSYRSFRASSEVF